MQAAAQSCLLVREAVAERMIPRAFGLDDLSLQILETLPLPAVSEAFEGFQKSDSPGSKIPF
jgi:hypothetical protein